MFNTHFIRYLVYKLEDPMDHLALVNCFCNLYHWQGLSYTVHDRHHILVVFCLL